MEELERVERQVREWETYVARAQALLTDLEQADRDRAAAIVRRCLLTFTATLDSHRTKLASLRAAGGPDRCDDHPDQATVRRGVDSP